MLDKNKMIKLFLFIAFLPAFFFFINFLIPDRGESRLDHFKGFIIFLLLGIGLVALGVVFLMIVGNIFN